MPILPIDLQTMFSHLNHVGKEQAVQKDGNVQHQILQGQRLVEKTNEKDKTVNEAENMGEGAEKIKEKEQEQRREENEAGRREAKEKEKRKPVVYQDPNLGHHIDITG